MNKKISCKMPNIFLYHDKLDSVVLIAIVIYCMYCKMCVHYHIEKEPKEYYFLSKLNIYHVQNNIFLFFQLSLTF